MDLRGLAGAHRFHGLQVRQQAGEHQGVVERVV